MLFGNVDCWCRLLDIEYSLKFARLLVKWRNVTPQPLFWEATGTGCCSVFQRVPLIYELLCSRLKDQASNSHQYFCFDAPRCGCKVNHISPSVFRILAYFTYYLI